MWRFIAFILTSLAAINLAMADDLDHYLDHLGELQQPISTPLPPEPGPEPAPEPDESPQITTPTRARNVTPPFGKQILIFLESDVRCPHCKDERAELIKLDNGPTWHDLGIGPESYNAIR